MGKPLLGLIASFAEGEPEAIKARAKSSYNHLVKEGRWRDGRTPYGHREEKQETGDEWKLVPDDYGTDTAGTLREIVRRLIAGESANSIAQWLNEDVSKTPTHEEWELANKKRDENTSKRNGNRKGGPPLLRGAFCTCGEPTYLGPGRNWPYCRCVSRTTHKPCATGSKGIAAHTLEDAVEQAFLLAAGDIEIARKVFRPGVDFTRDIEEVNRALSDPREDREADLYSSELGKQEYREAYKRLDARREQLIAQPTRPDTWEENPTGETYRERWSKLSTQHEKGKELRAAGVRAVIHAEPIAGLTAAQLMASEGHDGMWQHPVGRIQASIPMDLQRLTQ